MKTVCAGSTLVATETLVDFIFVIPIFYSKSVSIHKYFRMTTINDQASSKTHNMHTGIQINLFKCRGGANMCLSLEGLETWHLCLKCWNQHQL